jgi:aminoglycoside 6'-N-acetyltransferase
MTATPVFRRMTADDLPLMHEWLQRDHVRRWWTKHETIEEVVAHYLPAIEGDNATDLYLILLDNRAIGFIQTYLVSDHPEYAELVQVGDAVAGVDLFIADEGLTGRGIGPDVIRAFVREVVFARPSTIACVADPAVRNTVSIRAFEKAGFRVARTFFDPSDGEMHALVRLDRGASDTAHERAEH